GQGVHDNIGAEVERPAQHWSGYRVVDDQGHAMLVGDLGQGLQVNNVAFRITDGLTENGAGPFINVLGEGSGIVAVRKAYFNSLAWEGMGKQVVGAAVELADADDIIAGFTNGLDGGGNGRHTRGHGQCADSAFQSRHALFQHVIGRV